MVESEISMEEAVVEYLICGYVNRLGISRVVKTFKSPREASELVRVLNSSF
jgi:hypothetical protein